MSTPKSTFLHPPSLWLGLTGGIGSGKSTVAKWFAEWGAVVLDADQISRQLTLPKGAAIPAIQEAFGAQMIGADGAMDRQRMRERVFSDPLAKAQLEAILHPLVESEILRQAQVAAQDGPKLIVLDLPLLAESKRWPKRLDRILVIDCTEETQVERVLERSQLSAEQTMKIIRAQASREDRCALADWVIFNDHISLLELKEKSKTIFEQAQTLLQAHTP